MDRAHDLGLTEEEARVTIDKLLNHSYHLPKHNWFQDLFQYTTNNHPVFGICCHHPLHPLSWKIRVATLFGSVLMGLAITCLIYVVFVVSQQDFEHDYFELSTNKTKTGLQDDLDQNVSTLSVTSGNIALWTVGAFLHGLYDNMVWALAAGTCCTCCKDSKYCGKKTTRNKNNDDDDDDSLNDSSSSSTRTFVVMLSVVAVVAITFLAVSLQMALTMEEPDVQQSQTAVEASLLNASAFFDTNDSTAVMSGGIYNDTNITTIAPSVTASVPRVNTEEMFDYVTVDDVNQYHYIVSYLVELMLSYFVWYPIVGTILFSGCLSRGKEPLLGGRPYELRKDQELQAAEQGRIAIARHRRACLGGDIKRPMDRASFRSKYPMDMSVSRTSHTTSASITSATSHHPRRTPPQSPRNNFSMSSPRFPANSPRLSTTSTTSTAPRASITNANASQKPGQKKSGTTDAVSRASIPQSPMNSPRRASDLKATTCHRPSVTTNKCPTTPTSPTRSRSAAPSLSTKRHSPNNSPRRPSSNLNHTGHSPSVTTRKCPTTPKAPTRSTGASASSPSTTHFSPSTNGPRRTSSNLNRTSHTTASNKLSPKNTPRRTSNFTTASTKDSPNKSPRRSSTHPGNSIPSLTPPRQKKLDPGGTASPTTTIKKPDPAGLASPAMQRRRQSSATTKGSPHSPMNKQAPRDPAATSNASPATQRRRQSSATTQGSPRSPIHNQVRRPSSATKNNRRQSSVNRQDETEPEDVAISQLRRCLLKKLAAAPNQEQRQTILKQLLALEQAEFPIDPPPFCEVV